MENQQDLTFAYEKKLFEERIWVTKSGEELPLRLMTKNYLYRCISLLRYNENVCSKHLHKRWLEEFRKELALRKGREKWV